jgi:4-hydroxybenzoate polyprenyltransferase
MFASYVYNDNSGNIIGVFLSTVLPASIALAILNGASNTLNQVTDVKTDKISKPYRPIPRGIVSSKQALTIAFFMYVFAFCISWVINIYFIIFILLITFFTVTYSTPPRFKDKLFINMLWVGIPRGLLGVLASWSVFGNPLQPLPLIIGFISMMFLIGGSITKDIIDSEADKKTGTKTLVNTYGVKKAAILSFPFMFFPFAFIPIFIDAGLLDTQFILLTFLGIPSFFIFYLMIRDNKKTKRLENTSSWALMYVTYFFLAFGFSVLTIAG